MSQTIAITLPFNPAINLALRVQRPTEPGLCLARLDPDAAKIAADKVGGGDQADAHIDIDFDDVWKCVNGDAPARIDDSGSSIAVTMLFSSNHSFSASYRLE